MSKRLQNVIRKAQWLAGMVWALSWFELYLEIYRHHHVTPSLLLNPSSWFAGATAEARPGGWLRTVLACSALAPPLFFSLLLWSRLHLGRASDSRRAEMGAPFPIALAATAFGIMLCVLGIINQLIGHAPIDVDLTLRKGNGGFVVLGLVLAFVGVMLPRSNTAITMPDRQ